VVSSELAASGWRAWARRLTGRAWAPGAGAWTDRDAQSGQFASAANKCASHHLRGRPLQTTPHSSPPTTPPLQLKPWHPLLTQTGYPPPPPTVPTRRAPGDAEAPGVGEPAGAGEARSCPRQEEFRLVSKPERQIITDMVCSRSLVRTGSVSKLKAQIRQTSRLLAKVSRPSPPTRAAQSKLWAGVSARADRSSDSLECAG